MPGARGRGGAENIAGLWFARGGSVPRLTLWIENNHSIYVSAKYTHIKKILIRSRKNSKMVQIVQVELFVNSNTARSQI